MLNVGPYVPYPSRFPAQLAEYCQQIANVVRQGGHHDQRRHLLLHFLHEAFGIDTKEITLERKIRLAEARGRIDALWRHLIIEVKSDFDAERDDALKELGKYFAAQEHPGDYIALLTDGLRCELFTFAQDTVRSFKQFTLQGNGPLQAFHDLDQLLYTAKDLAPTPEDIVARFGAGSAVFNQSARALLLMLQAVSLDPMVQTKFREWNALLAKVYGSRLGTEPLFVRHTYLTMLSRLFVAAALFPGSLKTSAKFKALADGRFFSEHNLANLAEPDFFSWPLGTKVEGDFALLLENIARHLKVYDFDHLSGDILKELYQELIDPADRHDLGEYYTPDWLAAQTLEALDYHTGRLLDPSCGSGSFLFAAVSRLREAGHKGADLVKYASENLTGIDVHPVAVLMAKANLVLALRAELKKYHGDLYLRVYLADTLMTEENAHRGVFFVSVDGKEKFAIPLASLGQIDIDQLIDRLASLAKRVASSPAAAEGAEKAVAASLGGIPAADHWAWQGNFNLMLKLEREHRNSIWAYILKNAYRPIYLRREKVDVIAGNPPWLRYSFIKEAAYKDHVRELIFGYGLLDKKDRKLFTAMELATLFFIHCERHFLKEGGRIGLVLPKACIVPSKQHAAFQRHGFSQVHDYTEVEPLFNVRTCLLIRGPDHRSNRIPATYWKGRLPGKNTPWSVARERLEHRNGSHVFSIIGETQSPYYSEFLQGATLVPRCLIFIEPAADHDLNLETPFVRTSTEALESAKEAWRISVEGRINKEYLFATALSDDLVPFGLRKLRLCALPVHTNSKSGLEMIEPNDAMAKNKLDAYDWFLNVIKIYSQNQKEGTTTFQARLNYSRLLTNQNSNARLIVLYNAAGTNLSSALYHVDRRSKIHGLGFQSFIVQHKTYRFYPSTIDEGNYLVGILNATVTNELIKPFQTQGLMGERDIERRPFEVCPIPRFDPGDKLHRAIADASRHAAEKLIPHLPHLRPNLAGAREDARRVVHHELARLDELTRKLFASGKGTNPVVEEAAGIYGLDKNQVSLPI